MKFFLLSLLLPCTLFVNVLLQELQRFNGYKVYRIKDASSSTIQKLQMLQTNESLSFWTDPEHSTIPIDVMVAPSGQRSFETSFQSPEVLINNVGTLISNERPKIRRKTAKRMTWDDYYRYEEIMDWLHELAKEFPQIVQLIDVGQSYEGRNITGVKVSFKAKENSKKGVFLEGGMHAREWITVATVTYMLNEILRSRDPVVRKLVENYDWYVFPIYNPDGYVYSFSKNRMWRKTRSPQGRCFGVDPNRNWDYKWQVGDGNTCSEAYSGPKPFSECETRHISKYLKTIRSHLVAYISYHSYSQLVLLPYGDSATHRDNYDELLRIGTEMIQNIKSVNGVQYKIGTIFELLSNFHANLCFLGKIVKDIYFLDRITGSDIDWIKHNLKTRLTYVFELRDTGQYGFLLPSTQIIPTGHEMFSGIMTMLREVNKLL